MDDRYLSLLHINQGWGENEEIIAGYYDVKRGAVEGDPVVIKEDTLTAAIVAHAAPALTIVQRIPRALIAIRGGWAYFFLRYSESLWPSPSKTYECVIKARGAEYELIDDSVSAQHTYSSGRFIEAVHYGDTCVVANHVATTEGFGYAPFSGSSDEHPIFIRRDGWGTVASVDDAGMVSEKGVMGPQFWRMPG